MNLPELIGPLVNTDPQRSQVHKAVLWARDDLLTRAIGSFLKSPEWEVTRVSSDGDTESLIREIESIQPEVVILCRYGTDHSMLALRLLNEQCCLKVIILGLDSNQLQVYSKQNLFLRGAADLLSIIEKKNFSDCTPEKEAASEERDP